ncbi:MAG TPA: flagellar hook-basal body complex protein FliE [Aquificaceae bacterium]|nr:flagellar hook-basal body complex protein FliE [Aquificaceae bacterium]HIQ31443.1 flagellar hook-basal body complex protein FliE [Aquifex aeolicus]
MEIGKIGPGIFWHAPDKKTVKPAEFAEILKEFLVWVDKKQKEAKEIREAVLRGEDVPLHKMVVEFGKAEVALNLLIEVRNRLLEGFQELMRMQV